MGDNSQPRFVVTGDVNNDHHQDIVVTLWGINSIGVLLGYGNGTFVHGNTFSTKGFSYMTAIAVGDLNKDGNLDIIIANYGADNVGLVFGFGNGSFTSMTVIFNGTGFPSYFVQVSDVNNDTILDVVVSTYAKCWYSRTLRIWQWIFL